VRAGITAQQQHELTAATLSGWALGDTGFLATLESQTPRRTQPGKAGRPPAILSPIKLPA